MVPQQPPDKPVTRKVDLFLLAGLRAPHEGVTLSSAAIQQELYTHEWNQGPKNDGAQSQGNECLVSSVGIARPTSEREGFFSDNRTS